MKAPADEIVQSLLIVVIPGVILCDLSVCYRLFLVCFPFGVIMKDSVLSNFIGFYRFLSAFICIYQHYLLFVRIYRSNQSATSIASLEMMPTSLPSRVIGTELIFLLTMRSLTFSVLSPASIQSAGLVMISLTKRFLT